jgi:hypothetical protein
MKIKKRLDTHTKQITCDIPVFYVKMFGFNMGSKHEFLLIIFISKWSIWKARYKVKFDKIHINQNVLCTI